MSDSSNPFGNSDDKPEWQKEAAESYGNSGSPDWDRKLESFEDLDEIMDSDLEEGRKEQLRLKAMRTPDFDCS